MYRGLVHIMSRLRAAVFALLLVSGSACDGEILTTPVTPVPAPEPGDFIMAAPTRTGWEPVADALVAGCGTLDCHGQVGRNLRLFGSHSLRLASEDDPGGRPTTAAEYQASYWSTIGLEPEILDRVVRDGGDRAERLMILRKPLGLVSHKGGVLMQTNDKIDRCLHGWLVGAVDRNVCEEAWPRRSGEASTP